MELYSLEITFFISLPYKLDKIVIPTFIIAKLLIKYDGKSEVVLDQNLIVPHYEHEHIIF